MLKIKVREQKPLKLKIVDQAPLSVSVATPIIVVGEYNKYEGKTTVNPTFDTQRLETEGLFLQDDIIVNPIKLTAVSNTGGGKTIIIGG